MMVKSEIHKPKEKLSRKDILLFVCALGIYFFYMKSEGEIANSPSFVTYAVFFVLLFSLSVYQLKYLYQKFIIQKALSDRLVLIFLNIFKFSIISWFVTGMLLIPFNYYNIYISKNNNLETLHCDITGVSTFSKNRKLFYVLEGRTNVIYGYRDIMEDIKSNRKYKDYQFVAQVRKGFLNSYIIENWDIKKK